MKRMSEAAIFDKSLVKRDREALASLLRQAGAVVTDKRKLKCPFHDDKNPSAEMRESAQGYWHFYCYVCGMSEDYWALKARVEGRDVAEVLREEREITEPVKPKPVKANGKTYDSFADLIAAYKANNPNDKIEEQNPYTDPITKEATFYTLRLKKHGEERKTFRQVSRQNGKWQWTSVGQNAPLFNRARIIECKKILIVEGEKCVREFTKIGMEGVAATTSPGGAQAATKADWSILAGKDCYIWRDNDEPGLGYERDVINELRKYDCRVFRVRVEELGLEPKQDIADYLRMNDEGTNAGQVAAIGLIMHDAEPLGVTNALADKFDLITGGEYYAVPFLQKPKLSTQSKALLPGTLTTICGDPGAGKSFLVTEDAWRWVLELDESVRLLMLEDDDAFHQNRALAQISGYGDLLDPDFVAENGDWAKAVLREYREKLEKFSRCMETTNSEQWSLDKIAEWVKRHAENGVRIIIVDPITAAKVSDKPWIDDQKFLFTVKNVLEQTGASLILTTHPRLGQAGKPSLSGMAGGASYPRFSQSVLWLKHYDKEEKGVIFGGPDATYKRSIEVRKARNGRGQGAHIAVSLNPQNLCFDEIGIIDQNAQPIF